MSAPERKSAAAAPGPLEAAIRDEIAARGPMRLDRYMALSLSDPEHGYYMTRDPFGAAGDFITAPEVSQMFGELIGAWCADFWAKLARPENFILAELGPGRGTLMADAMRAAARMAGFAKAARLHLVETSPALAAAQLATLQAAGLFATWHERVDTLPDGPAIIIANEFFDALPIRQFERGERGWLERAVRLSGDRLVLGFMDAPAAADLVPDALKGAPVGSVVEVSQASETIATHIAERLAAQPGGLLAIDYGHRQYGVGDTLQAVSAHEHVPVLHRPGECDLTAHVNFAALADAARKPGAKIYGPLPQGTFLETLGLHQRAAALKANATPEQAAEIDAAVERLAGADQMGHIFKVLSVTSPNLACPAPWTTAN